MSAVRQVEPVLGRCAQLAGGLVDVDEAVRRARALQLEGRGADRAARDAVSSLLLGESGDAARRCHRQLIVIWQPVIVRWCRGGAGARVNPDDAAQDATIRLFEQLERIRDPTRIHAFVWGLVWRVLREHERIPAVVRWVLGRLPEDAPSERRLELELERSERLETIHRVLQRLGVGDRELLWLTYAEGLRRREVAELLELPEGTLNRRLTRARARFERIARREGLAPEVTRG